MSRKPKRGKQAKPVRRAPKPIGGRAVQDVDPLSVPMQAREAAQELFYEAMTTATFDEHVRLLNQVLETDPYCVDALAYMALEADDPETRLAMLNVAVATGQARLGKRFFRENQGHFWGLFETRPYMRAVVALATELAVQGELDTALEMFEQALVLNPGDNQGVRYIMLGHFLAQDQLPRASALLEQYPEDGMAIFQWGRALERFLAGDRPGAEVALTKAFERNRHLVPFIAGQQELPDDLPDSYTFGGESEAIIAWNELGEAFRRHPAFAQWMATQPLKLTTGPQPSKALRTTDYEKRVQKAWRPRFREIIALTDVFCYEYLTPEYAQTCRKMAARFCRPGSPAETGKAVGWAAGIVAAIAWVNALDSRDEDYGYTQQDLADGFGIGVSTVAAKLKTVRAFLKLKELDPDWTPNDLLIRNPKVWYVSINGMPVDLRDEPIEVQERALAEGLIPFVADPDEVRGPDLGGIEYMMHAIASMMTLLAKHKQQE